MSQKVRTGRLRDGDVVTDRGAKVRIEGKPTRIEGPGGRIVFMWPNLPILPGTRHADYPGTTLLTIMGDNSRVWVVSRR